MKIASAMICKEPRLVSGHIALSAYDGIWEPVDCLPKELRAFVTDDLGNDDVEYGGFLQILHWKVFEMLADLGLYCCFRAVEEEVLSSLNVSPPVEFYQSITGFLELAGFDIFTGNGWRSAATDGIFPIRPLDGEVGSIDGIITNKFGLIEIENDCSRLISLNDEKIPAWRPWHPVGVLLDKYSLERISRLYGDRGA
ncbi:hypothetical protein [Dokdonella sp.]|uniref:hypothetical protein n=1 Tax=Dokdonella sp. TaxID=2291710 RepID=UPI001B1ED148|nr:hypothetical protein [Dokdonella sp.]MBO9664167.1 hypothetical protein [Dokdonella sp.]